ncbi:unnamed protein product [Protopolystoma xenopodis]|uniref:Uncharacterized protein n=1 Tax=Protopolystoma xenopodis TaxID=117903 RepID=A0A448WJG2_9PLAT|nr:unnamed protein product [Protopolystoma xenopodis]
MSLSCNSSDLSIAPEKDLSPGTLVATTRLLATCNQLPEMKQCSKSNHTRHSRLAGSHIRKSAEYSPLRLDSDVKTLPGSRISSLAPQPPTAPEQALNERTIPRFDFNAHSSYDCLISNHGRRLTEQLTSPSSHLLTAHLVSLGLRPAIASIECTPTAEDINGPLISSTPMPLLPNDLDSVAAADLISRSARIPRSNIVDESLSHIRSVGIPTTSEQLFSTGFTFCLNQHMNTQPIDSYLADIENNSVVITA